MLGQRFIVHPHTSICIMRDHEPTEISNPNKFMLYKKRISWRIIYDKSDRTQKKEKKNENQKEQTRTFYVHIPLYDNNNT